MKTLTTEEKTLLAISLRQAGSEELQSDILRETLGTPRFLITNDEHDDNLRDLMKYIPIGQVLEQPGRDKLRIETNIHGGLVDGLRKLGHQVRLWDGYHDDLVTRHPAPDAALHARPASQRRRHANGAPEESGAESLGRLIDDFKPDAMLFDWRYFTPGAGEKYGEDMLRWLFANSNQFQNVKVVMTTAYGVRNTADPVKWSELRQKILHEFDFVMDVISGGRLAPYPVQKKLMMHLVWGRGVPG